VVSLAGAVGLRMSEVEIAGLAVAVFASGGWPGQAGVKFFVFKGLWDRQIRNSQAASLCVEVFTGQALP
jgi:hypothetical protein